MHGFYISIDENKIDIGFIHHHDVHGFYSIIGFELIKHPEWFMEIVNNPL